MSRNQTRARRRRAREDAERLRLIAEVEALWIQVLQVKKTRDKIASNDRLVQLLKSIADSDIALWPCLSDKFLGNADDMKALIAQLVAPHLSSKSSRRVDQRL